MAKKADLKAYGRELTAKLLRDMVLMRRFEEKAGQMYGLRKIGGFCHLYIGQEAVATGAVAALDLARDYVITAYRDHGHALACGMDPGALMAELYGKATGCSKGKGGSMHLFDAPHHFLGGHGIVGGQIPLAAGVAFKIRYLNEGGVVLCFFGDGAIHQGAFHESLNMAKIWKLPVIFICENNQYGMGTDFRRVSAVHDLHAMGCAYGIEGRLVDGMDVLAVYDAIREAAGRARADGEPGFIEARTYRYRGHSMSDPAKYRTKEELQAHKEQDPILILKARLEQAGWLEPAAYEALDAECKAVCEAAVAFADQSPEPPLSDLYNDVLV